MANRTLNDSLDTLAAPLGELIAAVGRGLGDAQRSLDLATIETLKALSGDEKSMRALRLMGYQPTWYRIPELEAEITASLTISRSEQAGDLSGPGALRMYLAPVDATYSNRYDYDLQAATVIKFRIVPVPPSPQAAEMKIVPDLRGVSSRQAGQRLAELGIPFEPTGQVSDLDLLAATSPAAGEPIGPGQKVTWTLQST